MWSGVGRWGSMGCKFLISTNGSSVACNSTSYRRFKEHITDSGDAGSRIDAVRVLDVPWRNAGRHERFAFIAQELGVVMPEAVQRGDNSAEVQQPWGVAESRLVWLMLKELQSLRSRVKALEAAR